MSDIDVITLETNIVRAKFLNYGATLVSFEILEDGDFVNKVLSFDVQEYKDHGMYPGAICGPTAGRISDGVYELGERVLLSKNAGDHHLHGGLDSYARKIFDYDVGEDSVVFTYSTNNKEYPGQQEIKITYEVKETSLTIMFEADTDTDIPMNITSHIYFTAFENDTVLDNKMRIGSTKRIELINQAPTRVVTDTTYTELNDIQVLDDPFVLDEGYILYESETKRLQITTTYDCVVVYTQNYASPGVEGINKGICFETQKWPNGINIEGYDAVLKAGEHYKYQTTYKFSNK